MLCIILLCMCRKSAILISCLIAVCLSNIILLFVSAVMVNSLSFKVVARIGY